MKMILILSLVVFMFACTHHPQNGKDLDDSVRNAEIILSKLSYQDGVLEGEIVNKSQRTARTIVLKISFFDVSGKQLFVHDFMVVPGGDGRSLLPQYSKHFNYKVTLDQSESIVIAGKVKSIIYE